MSSDLQKMALEGAEAMFESTSSASSNLPDDIAEINRAIDELLATNTTVELSAELAGERKRINKVLGGRDHKNGFFGDILFQESPTLAA